MDSLLVHFTLLWLKDPATWVSVVGPGAVSAWALYRDWLNRREYLLVLLAIAVGISTADLVFDGDHLMLLSKPWLPMALVLAAGVRWYVPPALKAYAMCWIAAIAVDFAVMIPAQSRIEGVHLPRGIGGAGLGDALFVEPLAVALGLLALRWERNRSARKAERVAASRPR